MYFTKLIDWFEIFIISLHQINAMNVFMTLSNSLFYSPRSPYIFQFLIFYFSFILFSFHYPIPMINAIPSLLIVDQVCFFSYKLRALLAILLAMLVRESEGNLICNGDFENYQLTTRSYPSSDQNQYFTDFITNNYSCWYTITPNTNDFQVKTTKNPSLSITKVADTVGTYKNQICQNVSLQKNATYELSYQILPDFSIASCNVSFSISGSVYYIGSYLSKNTSYLVSLQFTASAAYEEICFFPDNITYKSGDTNQFFGPMLDNVSLFFLTRPIKTVQVNFALTYEPINNQLTLQSEFCFSCHSQYNLPISYFNSIQIKIEDNEESNFIVAVDSQNFLKIIVSLKLQYDHQNFKGIKLTIPNATYLHFVCLINGRSTNVSSQNKQSQFIKALLPRAKLVGEAIRDVFNMLNMFTFSYFIVNLISFYNITLLYYFLHLKTLPGFVRSFFLSLAYIFFKRGSVLDQIQRFGWIPDNFQFDFSTLSIVQKMDLYKNKFNLWFAYYDIYTNFVQSNIEPLIMLSLLMFKFCLLKLIVHPFPMLKRKANLKWSRFFRIFSTEFSCFTPFLIISSATSLTNISEFFFAGKLNSMVQIFVIFLIIFVPVLSFLYSKSKNQNMKTYLRKNRNGVNLNKLRLKIKKDLLQANEEFTSSIMSCYIPLCIMIQSPPIFFVFTTPLILKKIITSFSQRKVLSCFNKFNKFFTILVWATHHFSFLGLYVIQLILEFNQDLTSQRADDIRTFLGYTIIINILMGGFFDMLNSLVELIHSIFIFMKKTWVLFKKNVIAPQKKEKLEQKQIKSYFRFKFSAKKVKDSCNVDTNNRIIVTTMSVKMKLQKQKVQNFQYGWKWKSNNKHTQDRTQVKFNDNNIQEIQLNADYNKNQKSKCKKLKKSK